MTKRDEFWVNSLFGAKTQRGLVQLHYQDWTLQVDTNVARKIARDMMEAAEAADQDHFLVHWAQKKIGVDSEKAEVLLLEYREWREQERMVYAERDRRDQAGER
jgi:hypothetical protein